MLSPSTTGNNCPLGRLLLASPQILPHSVEMTLTNRLSLHNALNVSFLPIMSPVHLSLQNYNIFKFCMALQKIWTGLLSPHLQFSWIGVRPLSVRWGKSLLCSHQWFYMALGGRGNALGPPSSFSSPFPHSHLQMVKNVPSGCVSFNQWISWCYFL